MRVILGQIGKIIITARGVISVEAFSREKSGDSRFAEEDGRYQDA